MILKSRDFAQHNRYYQKRGLAGEHARREVPVSSSECLIEGAYWFGLDIELSVPGRPCLVHPGRRFNCPKRQ
jgi:hypothetical protein